MMTTSSEIDQYAWQWDGRYIFRLIDRSMKVYFHAEVMGGPFLIVDHKNQKAPDCAKSEPEVSDTRAEHAQSRTAPRQPYRTQGRGSETRKTAHDFRGLYLSRQAPCGPWDLRGRGLRPAMAHDYAARLLSRRVQGHRRFLSPSRLASNGPLRRG